MESIEIANRQIEYNKEITVKYKLKIIKSKYNSKINDKIYTNYKIRIPRELIVLLEKYNALYFTIIDDRVHITPSKKENYLHKAKIQKHYYDYVTEYMINLSKKVFSLDDNQYFNWKITIEDNTIIDSTASISK